MADSDNVKVEETAGKKKSAAQLRRLERRSNIRNGIPVPEKPKTPPKAIPLEAMNAQQRRLAKRALAREKQDNPDESEAPSKVAKVEETPPVAMNAQQRRLAKRALAREKQEKGEVDEDQDKEEDKEDKEEGEASGEGQPSTTTMNARERRLAKRAAVRNGTVFEDEKEPEEDESELFKSAIPYVVFVGQLPYAATISDIVTHFKNADIPEKHMRVRLLTDSKTGKSKGMAFVEVSNAEEQHQALALHRSYFGQVDDGKRRRQINVEKSSGGGKQLKKQKITEARSGQESYMQETVTRIIDDYIVKNPNLKGVIDGDKYLLSMLQRCDASTVDRALEEFATREFNDIINPAAYLTTIVCQKLAEAFDDKIKSENELKQKEIGRKFNGNSGGGGGGGKKDGHGGSDNRQRMVTGSINANTVMPAQYQFPSSRGRGRGGRMGSERAINS